MVDARGNEGIELLDRTLERLREVTVDRAGQRGVLSAMRELAHSGSHGPHRLPVADLTVAVAPFRRGGSPSRRIEAEDPFRADAAAGRGANPARVERGALGVR